MMFMTNIKSNDKYIQYTPISETCTGPKKWFHLSNISLMELILSYLKSQETEEFTNNQKHEQQKKMPNDDFF